MYKTSFINAKEGALGGHTLLTHSQGFFVNMSPLGVEPVLSNWKVSTVTTSPPSRTIFSTYNRTRF